MSKLNLMTLGILGAAVLNASCASSIAGAKAPHRQPKIFTFESDDKGFNTKNFFYDNGEEVVAFDTQFTPELAQKSIDFLRTQTSHPITTVVVTHPNPDKFNGMKVFQDMGAKVIMSEKSARALQGVHDYKQYFFVEKAKSFTTQTYPKLSRPDQTFNSQMDLRLGSGETIQLRELSQAGVSSHQTVAFIQKLNALLVGDLVHTNAHAWLEGGIVNGQANPTLQSWISDLNEISQRFSKEALVYGGRGDAAALEIAVAKQIKYLKTADQIVNRYIQKLGARRSELKTDKANEHYQAIQKEFEVKFPEYKLGYLIGYGVYGLVNSKL